VIEDEEVETKKKKKQDLVFDSAVRAGGSRSLWKTDQKEQHGNPSLKDCFVSGNCCSPFVDATEASKEAFSSTKMTPPSSADGAGTGVAASGTLPGPEASSSATSSFLSSTPTILELSQEHQTSQT
jgi:hypothetical protein